jgi:hypothetical protein
MRGIKEGWYAIDDDGNFSSGLFPASRSASGESLSPRTETKASKFQHRRTEALSPNIRPRGRRQEIQPNPPLKDERHERDHYERHNTQDSKA